MPEREHQKDLRDLESEKINLDIPTDDELIEMVEKLANVTKEQKRLITDNLQAEGVKQSLAFIKKAISRNQSSDEIGVLVESLIDSIRAV